jgi:hypothetical protein
MTRKEAWVRFMAAALAGDADGSLGATGCAGLADAALDELERRWPFETHNDSDRPVRVGVDGVERVYRPARNPKPPRFVGDPE